MLSGIGEKDKNWKFGELIVKKVTVVGEDNRSGLFLLGPNGVPKMMIYVDENWNPKFQTLNDKAEIKDILERE